MCVCVCVHVCVHTCMHACVHVHVRTRLHAYCVHACSTVLKNVFQVLDVLSILAFPDIPSDNAGWTAVSND